MLHPYRCRLHSICQKKEVTMFQKNTYITRGIDSSLPMELISILWLKVQNVKDRKLDYLQVFEFKNTGTKNNPVLDVKWSQEVPNHEESFKIKGIVLEDVEKVWIICSGEGTEDEYSTMLLPEEY